MPELISMTRIEINDNNIVIENEHTSFVNEAFVKKLNIKEMLSQYQSIVKEAKNCNVSISYKGRIKHSLNSLASEYESSYNQYQSLFSKLKELCEAKMKKGIFVGYCDDLELKEIFDIRNQMMAMFYRSEPLSKVMEIKSSLDRLSKPLTGYSKITL